MASRDDAASAGAVQEALAFLQGCIGRRVFLELAYGEWVLSRFPMRLEEAEADEGLLTAIGDVEEFGEALLYSEVSLPLSASGAYEISIAAGELRLATDDGMRLHVTRLD